MTTLNLNQINLVGRLGSDPDIRYFESGAVVTNLSLAVSRNTKDKQVDWFKVEAWGKVAEVAANYTQKGSLIGIEGELTLDEWTDPQTGVLRSKPVIKVNRLELLSSPNNSETSQTNQVTKVNDDF